MRAALSVASRVGAALHAAACSAHVCIWCPDTGALGSRSVLQVPLSVQGCARFLNASGLSCTCSVSVILITCCILPLRAGLGMAGVVEDTAHAAAGASHNLAGCSCLLRLSRETCICAPCLDAGGLPAPSLPSAPLRAGLSVAGLAEDAVHAAAGASYTLAPQCLVELPGSASHPSHLAGGF